MTTLLSTSGRNGGSEIMFKSLKFISIFILLLTLLVSCNEEGEEQQIFDNQLNNDTNQETDEFSPIPGEGGNDGNDGGNSDGNDDGDSDDDSGSQPPSTPVVLSYTGQKEVTLKNNKKFLLKGTCNHSEGNKIEVRGSYLIDIKCKKNNTFKKKVDVSYLPNGKFQLQITHGDNNFEIEVVKNAISFDSDAFYELDNKNDIGADSSGEHHAQSVEGVEIVKNDQFKRVASFNGLSSGLELSDGTFLNQAFQKRTVAFWINPSDVETKQIVFDEGGSTNAFGIKIEGGNLTVGARSQGSTDRVELPISANQWQAVVASFHSGKLQLNIDAEEGSFQGTKFEIPSHSDVGGLGKKYGSGDAFNSSFDNAFTGKISQFQIFSKILSASEIALFTQQEFDEVLEVDPLKLALEASYEFENENFLGSEQTEKYPTQLTENVSQVIDADKGASLSLNGSGEESRFELSNGEFFNNSFSVRQYLLSVKTENINQNAVIVDEGGATNGATLRIFNGYLWGSFRAGGEETQTDLILDVSKWADQWMDIAFTFNEGKVSLQIVNKKKSIKRKVDYTEIPDHSDTGGLGKSYGSTSSSFSGNAGFEGLIHKFKIYNRVLNSTEIKENFTSSN